MRFLRGHVHKRDWGDDFYSVEDRGYETPCWIWKGSTGKDGYGKTRWRGRTWLAHVRAWVEFRGGVPEGMQLDHLCRQRGCVNPDHLEVVTPAENARRSAATKLTWPQVREIRARYAAGGISQPQLARDYGVRQGTISGILLGKAWVEA